MFGPLRKCYQDIEVRTEPAPGDVTFVFHTYHGLLLLFVQSEHLVACSVDDAKLLLGRLHRFNLTWGFFAAGVALIPILSYFNYRSQMRKIEKQIVNDPSH